MTREGGTPPVPGEILHRRRWLERRREVHERGASAGRWRRGAFRGASAGVLTSHAAGWDQRHWSSRLLHRIGEIVAHAGAGIVAAGLVSVWAVVGITQGFPDWWETVLYSVTSAVTFVMVFVIQHTQARQTSATQRKLDELLRSSARADSSLIALEEAPDEDLQALVDLNVADREAATREG